jgi:hypothetical protein
MLFSTAIIKSDRRKTEGNLLHVLKEQLRHRARVSDCPETARGRLRKRDIH